MSKKTTTIGITVKNWERLNKLKKLGESMNDVVSKVLDVYEASHQ